MKFNLSTLLLLVTSIACTIGWLTEIRRSQRAKAAWDAQSTMMIKEFEENALKIMSGAEALASAEISKDLIHRFEPLVKKHEEDDIFAFNEERELIDETSIQNIFQLWKNNGTFLTAIKAAVPLQYHSDIPDDLLSELANEQMKILKRKTADQIIERAQELGLFLPFSESGNEPLDTASEQYKSFQQFVSNANNAG